MVKCVVWVVWRDDSLRRVWWARTYDDRGRCDWLQGGFTSARKAKMAIQERLNKNEK
jgi:hypothetical protein